MKSQDSLKVTNNDDAAFAQGEENYVNSPISRKSNPISQPQRSFDIYSFIFKGTVVLLILAFLFVVALYYKVINP
jgi:hypothetical protein